MISRFRPMAWVVAVSPNADICQGLAFSSGVYPVEVSEYPEEWSEFSRRWLAEHQVAGSVGLLVAASSTRNPDANYRIEFIRLAQEPAKV